jgi:hypothetical protein
MMRPEVVEDGSALIEQRLDIDQIQGPDTVPEDLLADGEVTRSLQRGLSSALQILGAGCPEHPGRADLRRERCCSLRWGALEENLTQLGSAMRSDDDDLTSLQTRCFR